MTNLMLTCPQLGERLGTKGEDKCCFFDQKTHQGPLHDFGKLLAGYHGETVDPKVIDHIEHALRVLPAHPEAVPADIIAWLKAHEEYDIVIEAWPAAS